MYFYWKWWQKKIFIKWFSSNIKMKKYRFPKLRLVWNIIRVMLHSCLLKTVWNKLYQFSSVCFVVFFRFASALYSSFLTVKHIPPLSGTTCTWNSLIIFLWQAYILRLFIQVLCKFFRFTFLSQYLVSSRRWIGLVDLVLSE